MRTAGVGGSGDLNKSFYPSFSISEATENLVKQNLETLVLMPLMVNLILVKLGHEKYDLISSCLL
jgi:hypothetical protein